MFVRMVSAANRHTHTYMGPKYEHLILVEINRLIGQKRGKIINFSWSSRLIETRTLSSIFRDSPGNPAVRVLRVHFGTHAPHCPHAARTHEAVFACSGTDKRLHWCSVLVTSPRRRPPNLMPFVTSQPSTVSPSTWRHFFQWSTSFTVSASEIGLKPWGQKTATLLTRLLTLSSLVTRSSALPSTARPRDWWRTTPFVVAAEQ